MNPKHWPNNQDYTGRCARCGGRFHGPKLAPACWECYSSLQYNQEAHALKLKLLEDSIALKTSELEGLRVKIKALREQIDPDGKLRAETELVN